MLCATKTEMSDKSYLTNRSKTGNKQESRLTSGSYKSNSGVSQNEKDEV